MLIFKFIALNKISDKLKKLYLIEFKKDIKYDSSYFNEFYKLTRTINKKIKNAI